MRNSKRKSIRQALSCLTFAAIISFLTMPVNTVSRRATARTTQTAPQAHEKNGLTERTHTLEQTTFGRMPMQFESNYGQFDKRVRFYSRGHGFDLFLTKTDAVYVLRQTAKSANAERRIEENEVENQRAVALWMSIVGANPQTRSRGVDELENRVSYLKTSDPAKRQANIPTFQRVRYAEIYAGVDLVYYGNPLGEMEYDFIVEPNANHNQIELEFAGAEEILVNGEGNLEIRTEVGTIIQRKPFAYQERDGIKQEIESRYVLEEKKESEIVNRKTRVRFEIGEYDRSKGLVIDPSVNLSNLAFSTLLGGSDFNFAGGDWGRSIAVDGAGNVYVTGFTQSSVLFPTTPGAFDTTYNGDDAFVAKLNSTGTALIYSTYLGGNLIDQGSGIAVDSSGNAYVTGSTTSPDYPTTAGAYDTTHNGFQDIFITKLNATGTALVYSTYVGGDSTDGSSGGLGLDGGFIELDSSGNAYVTGLTASSNYPTTAGAYDTTQNGNNDIFVTKLNPAGTALVYSTFIGGNSADRRGKATLDSSGNVYITGTTFSGNYPTTAGAYDTTYNGNQDVFVTKLNAAGSALAYSTFIGGSSVDNGNDIAVDSSGNAYITGETQFDGITPYPTTVGAFDRTHNGLIDVFVTKLNAAGTSLTYSTFIGSTNPNGGEQGYGIALDKSVNALVTGGAGTGYPTTSGAFDAACDFRDVFLTKLNSGGTALIYSTCIGGGADEEPSDVAVDPLGNAFITGFTTFDSTANYPTTPGAFQTSHAGPGGRTDAFISKFGGIAPSDFDGDGKSDISVFRPSDGNWYVLGSSNGSVGAVHWGIAADKVASADYDGDLKTDFAVWRAGPLADLYILNSSDGTVRIEQFGQTGDNISVVGDYDGDGKADPAVYRDAAVGNQSYFYYRGSFNNPSGNVTHIPWGTSGDIPASGDYNGDGQLDPTVFRPSNGIWYSLNLANNTAATKQWGLSTDRLVPADYDADGKTDHAVFRNGVWYILQSGSGIAQYAYWGLSTDQLVPADYDGDGRADPAIYRDGTWYIRRSRGGDSTVSFGLSTDIPTQSAYLP